MVGHRDFNNHFRFDAVQERQTNAR